MYFNYAESLALLNDLNGLIKINPGKFPETLYPELFSLENPHSEHCSIHKNHDETTNDNPFISYGHYLPVHVRIAVSKKILVASFTVFEQVS